jgi:hypothetical protein
LPSAFINVFINVPSWTANVFSSVLFTLLAHMIVLYPTSISAIRTPCVLCFCAGKKLLMSNFKKKKLVMSISAQAQVVRLKRQWLRRLSRIGLGASATSVITRTWSPASSRWKITTNDAEFANTNETLPCSCQALANCKMKLQNLQWSDNTPIFGI